MFGLLFLGVGATISRILLLSILVSGKIHPLVVLELVDCQVHLEDGGVKYGTFICARFLEHIKKLILISQLHMLSSLMELKMYRLVVNF